MRYEGQHPVWRGPSDLDLEMREGSMVLELGCGDGKTLRPLLSSGHQVIGLDSSGKALRSCMRRAPVEVRPGLVQADLVSLPFGPGIFDAVLAHHVLEHLYEEERAEAALEIARILRPSGLMDLRAFSVQDMRRGKGTEVERGTFQREGIPYHYFTEEEVVDLFRDLIAQDVRTEIAEKKFAGAVHRRAVIRARFRACP